MDTKNEGNYNINDLSEIMNDDLRGVLSFIENEIIKVYPTTSIKVERL